MWTINVHRSAPNYIRFLSNHAHFRWINNKIFTKFIDLTFVFFTKSFFCSFSSCDLSVIPVNWWLRGRANSSHFFIKFFVYITCSIIFIFLSSQKLQQHKKMCSIWVDYIAFSIIRVQKMCVQFTYINNVNITLWTLMVG